MAVIVGSELQDRNGKDYVIFPSERRLFTTAGYDLRVGHLDLLELNGASVGELGLVHQSEEPTQEGFTLPANSTSLIVTRERVWLSERVMGTIHARGSLALRGLVVNPTTVDPNWDGKMLMRVYNTSPRDEHVPYGEAFCTMVVHELSTPTSDGTKTNPTRAVDKLSEIYGSRVGSALYGYLHSEEATKEKIEGDSLIERAKLKQPIGSARSVRKKRKSTWSASARDYIAVVAALSCVLAGVLMIISTLLVMTKFGPNSIFVGIFAILFGAAIYLLTWMRRPF